MTATKTGQGDHQRYLDNYRRGGTMDFEFDQRGATFGFIAWAAPGRENPGTFGDGYCRVVYAVNEGSVTLDESNWGEPSTEEWKAVAEWAQDHFGTDDVLVPDAVGLG